MIYIKDSNISNKSRTKAKQRKTKHDSSFLHGKSHFEDNGTENYLVFQPVHRYFKNIANSDHISAWKSKGLSDESIKRSPVSNNSLAPALFH